MATAREIITQLAGHQRQLERRVSALEAQVEQLLKGDDLAWDSPLNLGGDGTSAESASDAKAPPLDANAGSTPAASIKITEEGIDIPAPTERQRELRASVVDRLGIEHLPPHAGITPEAARDAFLKGGLAWLYNWDNHYCYELPYDVKQVLLEDLAINGPQDYVLGVSRDLLKLRDDEKGAHVQVAIDADDSARDHFGGTTGAGMVPHSG